MKQIFIGGCGRSGTTFLGALIGRHIDSIVPPESQFKFDLLRKPNDSGSSYFHELESNWRFNNWGLDIDTLKPKLNGVSGLSAFLTLLVKEYGALVGCRGSDVWVDHTPNNIDYMISLSKVFPDAKFIHLIRDGRGVAASIIKLPWGPNTVVAAADWWVNKLAIGLAAEQFFSSAQVLKVRYEDLIMKTSDTLDVIVNFVGISKCENAPRREGRMVLPKFTVDQHMLVNKLPDQRRINGWRHELTVRQIEIFELKAQVLMQYLGYERYSKGDIPPINTYESVLMKYDNLFRKYYKDKSARRFFQGG